MRTTLTLDAEVSFGLEALRRKRGLGLKAAMDDALRRGIRAMTEGSGPKSAFLTRSVDLGVPRPLLDNVAEALATAEGDGFHGSSWTPTG
jgi:hypothetical protein